MIFTQLSLPGAYIIELEPKADARGFFARTFCEKEFERHGLRTCFVQCNCSWNEKTGTLRGMHFQRAPHAEAKLIRCTQGKIFDVLIDLRPDSPTFTRWEAVELTSENRKMVYVPEGFAHGYQTLTPGAEVFYMTSEPYTPGAEGGVRWNDPFFGIQWPLPDPILSDKDRNHPDFRP
jgi:dTDP-4-dehydrorhamnose 3,5-epimerase